MSGHDILKIVLVSIILMPLIYIQSGPGMAPAWMGQRLQGVPLTAIATSLWFITIMALTAVFAGAQASAPIAENKSKPTSQGGDKS